MKRHNFGGLRASHGVSVSHRSHGSTGQRQSPGKTFKNKKMAGHLGAERVTTQSLEVDRRRCRARRLDDQGVGAGQPRRLRADQGCGQAQSRPEGCRSRPPCGRCRPTAESSAGRRPPDEAHRAQSRQSGGRRYRARRRGVRPADPPRHPRPGRQLAAGQAPRRHPQDQGDQRDPGHDQEALQAEGHRARPPGQPALAAIPRRRGDLRAGRAQPRILAAEEGPQARPQDRAVGEAGARASWS